MRGDNDTAARADRAHQRIYEAQEQNIDRSVTLTLLKAAVLASQGLDGAADAVFDRAVVLSSRPAHNDPYANDLPAALAAWSLARTCLRETPEVIAETTPTEMAAALRSRLDESAERLGLDDVDNPAPKLASFQSIHETLLRRTVTQRKFDRPEDSRRLSEIYWAFAQQMVEAYPTRVESQLLLSDATLLMSKVAWHEDDLSSVRYWLDLSYNAATEAGRLAPAHPSCGVYLNDRHHRLARLKEAEREALGQQASK